MVLYILHFLLLIAWEVVTFSSFQVDDNFITLLIYNMYHQHFFKKLSKWQVLKFQIKYFLLLLVLFVVTNMWNKWLWLIIAGYPPPPTPPIPTPSTEMRWELEFCLFKNLGTFSAKKEEVGKIVQKIGFSLSVGYHPTKKFNLSVPPLITIGKKISLITFTKGHWN